MKLSEVYTSVQGEGPNTGRPITFVRFGGCNLRCPGWGSGTLPDGTVVDGCDTVFAVYPEWRDTWDSIDPSGIIERIPESPKHVCLTGGEPLIQPKRDMATLVEELIERHYLIDLFTNGSRELPAWTQHSNVTVVMDWKLQGSGEADSFDIQNLNLLKHTDAIKFVIKDYNDFCEALLLTYTYDLIDRYKVWIGPVWGTDPRKLALWIEEEAPWARMNIQTHKYIWHPDERRV